MRFIKQNAKFIFSHDILQIKMEKKLLTINLVHFEIIKLILNGNFNLFNKN